MTAAREDGSLRPVVVQVFDYSLDGIIGAEGSEFFEYCRAVPDDPDYDKWLTGSLERAGVHVMGRVTYQEMAQYFPTASGAVAEVMNRTPKAVFSRTLDAATWPESTIVSQDAAAGIAALRRQGEGEILAHGGISFVRSLTQLDLVDEYRLTVYPYLAGTGTALFAGLPGSRRLELTSSLAFGNGTVSLTYRRCR